MIDERYYGEFAKFFNTAILTRLADRGNSTFVSYVLQQSGFQRIIQPDTTFAQLYKMVYALLSSKYRCEYVYKNSIVNQILVGRHSVANSTLFSEFRAGRSKADVLVLNGTSSVYEIKTELDNLDRLPGQIQSYLQLFDRVYVITHDDALVNVKALVDDRVGLLVLDNRGQIVTNREAASNKDNVFPSVMFDSLRKPEYKLIIERQFGNIPDVPNTRLYKVCKEKFVTLPPAVAHDAMVEALKSRKRVFVKRLLHELPEPLKMTCLNSSLSQRQWNSFQKVLKTRYVSA